MYMDAKPSRRDIDTDTEMLWVRDSRVLNTAWGRIKKKKKKNSFRNLQIPTYQCELRSH